MTFAFEEPQTGFYRAYFHGSNTLRFTDWGSLKKPTAQNASDRISQPGGQTTLTTCPLFFVIFPPHQNKEISSTSCLHWWDSWTTTSWSKRFRSKQATAQRLTCTPKSLIRRKRKEKWGQRVWNWHRCRKIGSTTRLQLHGSHGRGQGSGLRWGFFWKCETDVCRWAGDIFFKSLLLEFFSFHY